MSIELQTVLATVLILSALLAFQGGLVPVNQGFGWGLGSRDEPKDQSALQGRTNRVVANHIEGMMLFVPLALIVEMMGLTSSLTVIGAWLYLVGRLVFAPVYLMGIAYLRSAVWGVATLGTAFLAFEVIRAAL